MKKIPYYFCLFNVYYNTTGNNVVHNKVYVSFKDLSKTPFPTHVIQMKL